MTDDPDKPKRSWPRFTVRTFVIAVTLVCAYVACWGPTKTWGVTDVKRFRYGDIAPPPLHMAGSDTTAYLPLVVKVENLSGSDFYLWFFGYIAKLPYEYRRDYPLNV